MSKPTYVQILRAVFLSRPNMWVDGRYLARHAGYAAWRSRVSDLRLELRKAQIGTIENRVTRYPDFRVSEYRFVPRKEEPHNRFVP